MPPIQATLAILLAAAGVVHGGLVLEDGGTPAGCTGSTGCCIPTCDIQVQDVKGCSGAVRWSGTCQWNYDNPMGTQDVGGCDDHQMTWLKDPSGKPVIDVYQKSTATYDRFAITDCKSPSKGGSQCSPSDGGCSAGPA